MVIPPLLMMKVIWKKLCGNTAENDSDALTKWILSFAQIFGHWPFTNQININRCNQLNRIKMTIRDYLWLIFTFALYLAFMCALAQYWYIQNVDKVIRISIFTCITLAYTFCSLINILLAIYNRQSLLQIISIIQQFDSEVSVPECLSKVNFHININYYTSNNFAQMEKLGWKLDQKHFKRNYSVSVSAVVIITMSMVFAYMALYMVASNAVVLNAQYMLFILLSAFASHGPVAFFILLTYFLMSICLRFRQLNDALWNTIARPHAGPLGKVIDSLNSLTIRHDMLTEGVKTINNCFKFQVSLNWLMFSCFGTHLFIWICLVAGEFDVHFSAFRRLFICNL